MKPIVPYDDVLDADARGMMVAAVLQSMGVVRRHQQGRYTDILDTKRDGTLAALSADKESDKVGKEILRKIPGVIVHGEESGAEGESDIVLFLDGLDGSMPYAVGAGTSTVIAAAYCKSKKEVFYCLVGNPQTGQVWQAGAGLPATVGVFTQSGPTDMAPVTVSNGVLDGKSRVMIDSYPGFRRDGRVILSTGELDRLHSLIQARSGLLMLGSNGIHHALVANGGKGAVAAITTAIGGPWDVCPVLLVLQAGGEARAFAVETDGSLTEKNPLAVTEYDIVISGNSEATVATLVECLFTAKGR